MKKTLTAIIIITTLLILLPPKHVNAEGEFATEYEVIYDVAENGETKVTYDITIINQRADIVATKYSLSLTQLHVTNIEGTDKEGKLKLDTETEGDTITVNAELNEQVVGVNGKNNFQLTFKTRSIASRVGKVWNVNIPPVQNLESTNKYDLTINVPNSFGPTIFIAPSVQEETSRPGYKIYKFTKEKLIDKGISSSFGEYQILNFRLKYQLQNDGIFTSIQEIALPPDITDQQKVSYHSINPPPYKIKSDTDGNVIALYKVKPNEILDITLIGTTRVMGRQIDPAFGGSFEEIPGNIKRSYTSSKKYWESDSQKIKEIAQSLKKPEQTVAQNAKHVYDYVIENLNYDFTAVNNAFINRKGALGAISTQKQIACMEFTDLFIAISRAMGIPARELNGYAFSDTNINTPLSINLKGGDLLHAWAEFYDPKYGWIAVDPTWGATSKTDYFTKLDTNHFVFVIKGVDSEYPLPAGVYRVDDREKLIEIEFAEGVYDQGQIELSAIKQAKDLSTDSGISIASIVAIFAAAGSLTIIAYWILHRIIRRKTSQQF